MFNLTMTYDHDSDIFDPYGGSMLLEASDHKPDIGKDYTVGKDKVVFAAISNCYLVSRIAFLKELQKYVEIDVYGGCQTKIQPNSNNTCKKSSDSCEKLKARYKFVIAIENSYCKDYVTEKFYYSLTDGLVPVTLNGGNLRDPSVAPPESFINIEDFKSVRELGEYLNYLNQNDEAYNRYYTWKSHYKLYWPRAGCNICEAVWANGLLNTNKMIDSNSLWSKDKCSDISDIIFDKINNTCYLHICLSRCI